MMSAPLHVVVFVSIFEWHLEEKIRRVFMIIFMSSASKHVVGTHYNLLGEAILMSKNKNIYLL